MPALVLQQRPCRIVCLSSRFLLIHSRQSDCAPTECISILTSVACSILECALREQEDVQAALPVYYYTTRRIKGILCISATAAKVMTMVATKVMGM